MKLKNILKIILFAILFLAIGITISNAAYSASNKTVKSGEKVTISVTSSTPLDSYNLDLDKSGELIFNSCSKTKNTDDEMISINGSSIGYLNTSGTTKNLGTYTFTAPTVTKTETYTVRFKVDQSTSVEATVTVNPKVDPKPDPEPTPDPIPDPPPPAKATMTKVQVGDKTYTKTGFTVKVANDVTSIKVVPTISNGESYTINGGTSNDVKLEEGTNTVIIKLASGNSYKIYVRREAKEDDTPNIIDEPTEEVKVGLKSLLIKGVAEDGEEIELSYAPEFFSEIYEYQMLLDETLSHITKLDIQAIGLQNDFIIDITGNEELKEGENTITITVKSQDGKTTVTYTIVVTKEAKAEEVLATVDVEPEVKKPLWNTTQKILITVFTSIIAIMGIVFAVIEYRYQKEHKGEKKERNREETLEEEPSFSDINIETQEKEEVSGDVPFATIGFENEVDKENVRKEEPKFQKIVDQSNEVEEELKKQTKKGKHF